LVVANVNSAECNFDTVGPLTLTKDVGAYWLYTRRSFYTRNWLRAVRREGIVVGSWT